MLVHHHLCCTIAFNFRCRRRNLLTKRKRGKRQKSNCRIVSHGTQKSQNRPKPSHLSEGQDWILLIIRRHLSYYIRNRKIDVTRKKSDEKIKLQHNCKNTKNERKTKVVRRFKINIKKVIDSAFVAFRTR